MDIFKGLFKEFGWFIYLLAGIGILWFFTGGYQNEDAHRPYIKPLAPVDSGQVYGKEYASLVTRGGETLDLPTYSGIDVQGLENALKDFFDRNPSSDTKNLYFIATSSGISTNTQNEYLTLQVNHSIKGTLDVSGFLLRGSAYEISARLPQASTLPLLGNPYSQTDVFVPAKGTVVVSSGASPIGTSFRVNMCSGYLGQYQTYTPPLAQDCPDPSTELVAAGLSNDSSCVAFVKTLPRCTTYNDSYPSSLSAACRAFVGGSLTYNSCVARHKEDAGFYTSEWRLFLEQKNELWRDRHEIIRLFDKSGNLLDAVVY